MRMMYPGSFDPVTRGHLDIITRASRMCDELIVAVLHNPDKRGAIPVDGRVRLLKKACAHLPNVRIVASSALTVDCAKACGADCLVRGVRPLGDFESEYSMAQINRMLGGVETLLMTTSETCAGISSSIVRQIASFGGEIDNLVPEGLAQDIRAALAGPSGEEEEP
ncbi:MAG: pantetheine-phosphate adenylyltransferase [Candidatus Ventricola sp.]